MEIGHLSQVIDFLSMYEHKCRRDWLFFTLRIRISTCPFNWIHNFIIYDFCVITPYCIQYCVLTFLPSLQAVSVTTTPSAVVLTRQCTRPVGGGVEVCVKAVCTTLLGQSVTSVPQATSQTPAAKWTILMPAYVSGSNWKALRTLS